MIKVTQKHIDDGEFGNSCFCPIALALKAEYPKESISVGLNGASIGKRRYLLPSNAQLFILSFDNKATVKPFEFDLTSFTLI